MPVTEILVETMPHALYWKRVVSAASVLPATPELVVKPISMTVWAKSNVRTMLLVSMELSRTRANASQDLPVCPNLKERQLHLNNCVCVCISGDYCDTKIKFCSPEFNPCSNGAKCQDHFTHYTCECMPGFHGINCTDNIDDCQNHICQNGGTCVDGVNDYICMCPDDFTGKYCEGHNMVSMMYPQTSPCQNHECKHGVCFQPNPSGSDYLCKCHPGYTGKWCEYLTSISFVHNNSFVEMEPLRTKPDANVTIVFSTSEQNGILMYDGQDAHWAVELFNGRIRVSYDVGNYPVSTMYSFEMVADSKYHSVELLSIKKNFTLRVDRGLARSIINDGSNEYLKLTTPLYLGGLPPEPAQQAYKNWQLRNLTSFKGCMREVWINHKLVDFENAARQQKITPGCALLEGENTEDDEQDFMDETPHISKEVSQNMDTTYNVPILNYLYQ